MVIGGYFWSDGTDTGTLSPYIFDFTHTLFLSFRHLYHHFPFLFSLAFATFLALIDSKSIKHFDFRLVSGFELLLFCLNSEYKSIRS